MTSDTRVFRNAFESSPIGIVVENLDGEPIYVNPAFCSFLGFTEDELGNKHCVDFSPAEDAQKDWTLFQQLRAGAIDRYQLEKRYFRKDGSLVWGRLSLCLFKTEPSRLVLAMVEDITDKKTAEEALRESEQTFRSCFREAGVGMVIVSPEGRYLAANRTFCDYLGYTEQELLGRTVESVTLPEDWQEFAEKLQEALMQDRGFQWLQKRCLHKSGVIVYTESSTTLIRSREGSPQFFIAHVLDITQRKKAEEALSGMTQKLIEAQEQERARIARELHDDVSQQLALLAVELDRWNQSSDDVNLHDHIQNTRRRIIEISQDVQSLSHQLHSSKLEYLGLVAAANGFSKEISEKNGVLVEFREDGVPRTLPNEVSLALFRILQQALHNAVEHSGTKQVEVRLWRQSDEVHLTVKDFGQGFVVSAMQNIGLGLTSMRQRARLVNGEVAIDSKPMCGTTIHARIPLLCEPHAEKQAV
jgi:PAS domain S-box-containing protein